MGLLKRDSFTAVFGDQCSCGVDPALGHDWDMDEQGRVRHLSGHTSTD
jgi:hypothetical protein